MAAMRRLLPLMLVLSGCEIATSEPLPDGYVAASTRSLTIHAGQPLTDRQDRPLPVRTMGGFDGDPTVPNGTALDVYYQTSGVKAVRLPRGWGCEHTLDEVFPSVLADPETDDSYRFAAIEALATGFVSHGMLPIWQAIYDVGTAACHGDGPVAEGDLIDDPVLWGQVVAHAAGYLNRRVERYFNPEYKERLADVGLSPGYVELLPDPAACCGYAALGFDYLQPVYAAVFESLARWDDESPGSRILAVAAPSFRVATREELSDASSLMSRFLEFVAERPAGQGPDVLSLLSSTRSPDEQVALLQTLKKRATDLGLPSPRVADLGMRVAPAVWAAHAGDLGTLEQRSAYAGSFLTMAKILGQDTVELIVPDRWGGPLPLEDASLGEDLFLAADGSPLPAFHTLMPFFLMDLGKAVRIRVEDDDDASGARDIRALAGVKEDGSVGIIIAVLPTPDDARIGYRVTYRLRIDGLPDGPRTLRRAVIDAGSTGFRFIEASQAMPTKGVLTVARQATAPSVQYLELNTPDE